MSDAELWRELGQQLRVDSIRAAAVPKSGHPTSSMSAADLMAVLLAKYLRYDFDQPDDPRNDHLIFSKGHASPLLYSVYKAAGAVSDEELLTFRKLGSRLEGHPTPKIPWVDVATGSLGQGLPIAVGVALAGQEARPAAVQRLVPLRRQRARRGIDVGGVRARGVRGARQPDRDPRHQPARPARRDDARLGSLVVHAAHRGVRLGRDRDRRARRRRDRPRVRGGAVDDRPPDGDRRADDQGPRREGGREPGELARQGARRSGSRDRGARRRAEHRRRRAQARRRRAAARVRDRRARAADLRRRAARSRRARRTATRCSRSARDAATSSRSTARSRTRRTPTSSRRRFPIATSRCTSRSSSSSPAAVGLQVRGWKPFASTFAAFLSRAYDFVRMAAISQANIRLSRLARRRLDRRGRAVADGARGPRRVPRGARLDGALPERREPDGEARRGDGRSRRHLVHPHDARRHARDLRRRRRLPRRRRKGRPRRRRRHARRRRDHAARGAEGGGRARRRTTSRPA